ncbi:hypothetical protein [Serratia fonticola]|uniref:hypothetical protein n=1 Tax=Serratia fonticola TaxID=47917 RepID=UPI000E2CB511|nr:hypothetical protein [Serratia fonticola]RDL20467.1 hypothetical protein DFO62_11168 [Serratia fonticola]
MTKSFQKMTEFERFATLPSITIDELAKCLVGISPDTAKKNIANDKLEIISHIKIRMKRTLEEIFKAGKVARVTSYGIFKEHPHPVNMDEKIESDIIYAIGYNCKDDEETPEVISDKCKNSVSSIAMNTKTKSFLPFIGGEAEKLGSQLIANSRGLYKKEEEVVSLTKIIGILVNILASEKNKSNPSKWLKKDQSVCIEHIKELIDGYVESNGISSEGLRASSLRAKLSSAIKAIHD